jgi:hypothetical protein
MPMCGSAHYTLCPARLFQDLHCLARAPARLPTPTRTAARWGPGLWGPHRVACRGRAAAIANAPAARGNFAAFPRPLCSPSKRRGPCEWRPRQLWALPVEAAARRAWNRLQPVRGGLWPVGARKASAHPMRDPGTAARRFISARRATAPPVAGRHQSGWARGTGFRVCVTMLCAVGFSPQPPRRPGGRRGSALPPERRDRFWGRGPLARRH